MAAERESRPGSADAAAAGLEAPPRIVVVGASAGGLEPLERLFAALPPDTGCAFVVVQHLSPDFRSMMGELLGRHTTMRIRRLEEGMTLEPDCIHLNVPRTDVTMHDGRVKFEDPPDDSVTPSRPIDALLDSLADTHGDRVLAVVLSGTGSDGLAGCRRIREHGGTVIAQSLADARFDSMPRAIIEAGLADVVAPAPAIAERIGRWASGHPPEGTDGPQEATEPLADILGLVRERHGTDFLSYKHATVARRLWRRAHLHGILDLEDYLRLLHRDPDELDELYGDLLIEVTAFFRDAEAFASLEAEVLPSLVGRLAEGHSLRLWVAGCASGEEAYSLAILLAEHSEAAGVMPDVRILATDVHARSLERAATGRYPLSSVRHLTPGRVERYFETRGDHVRVRADLRRMVMFSTHDVVRDTPFTRLDLLSCRNLLIYLNTDVQRHVIAKFHGGLADEGCLFLGPSENIADLDREFEVIDRKWRLYRKRRDSRVVHEAPLLPDRRPDGDGRLVHEEASGHAPDGASARTIAAGERSGGFRRAYQSALEQVVGRYAPPGFLLTGQGELVHIFGEAGSLLPMRHGAFTSQIVDLVRAEFRGTLFTALQTAREPSFERFERRVQVPSAEAGGPPLDYEVTLEPVPGTGHAGGAEPAFLLLTLASAASPPPAADVSLAVPASDGTERADGDVEYLMRRIRDLEADLQGAEQRLQTTVEELETTNEELQSTNQELTTSNEELQSTNEELHSVNEELFTVSAEHQRRIEELSELSADVDHLLSSSEIGTVFLDGELCIRRCSDRAERLFGFGPRDLGREIERVRSHMPEEIAALPRRVLQSGAPIETDVMLGERRYLLRLLPYLDADGTADGVLMSTVDITELTETRRELRRLDEEYRAIVEDTASFIVRWRADDGRITYCNAIYAGFFDREVDAVLGLAIDALVPEAERERFFGGIDTLDPGESRFFTIVRDEPDGRPTCMVGYTRAIADAGGRIVEYQSTGQDLSEEYLYRQALERLIATTRDTSLEHDERLQVLLALGLDYLRLDSAFISRIEGERYHVVAVAGRAAARYGQGDILPLEETVCANLPDGTGVLAIDHLARSPLASHPCHAATGIESFVGARVSTAVGNYGSISFSSSEPRPKPFTMAEESFVMLLDSWIGYLIDSRHQLERIAESNDYYQSLYLGVPVVMCLTDAAGIVVEISDEWSQHIGTEREATLGMPFVDVLEGEEDRRRAAEAIRTGIADDLSLCVHRADGLVVEHEMSCRTRAIGTREDMRLIVLNDVSRRVRALDEVESRNRDLAHANENLNQFAFVASHDLQEPLRKIQQFSGFLVEDEGDALTEDGRYHLKVIVEAAERMSTLIRDLLQYSRASRNSLDREPVSLDAVLAQVRNDLELPLSESGADLRVSALPRVSGDPILLLQLFTNLVSNAVKYRDGTRPLVVEVSAGTDASSGVPCITVVDNGIGFDPLYRTRVFEPFTRLHGTKEYQGSGIGLAICATVCRKHGWRIEADARKGEGATFSVLLAPRDDAEGGTGDAAQGHAGAGSDGESER